ncbi:MAG: hypothetical protein OXT72_03400, partial [Gammaproteobacteria bacterium]|nr:hypothetical protein [Gammaproteobacteria bacterium]MDE0246843.1 hypothetical protein [Gammaproteobacteria bacterium]
PLETGPAFRLICRWTRLPVAKPELFDHLWGLTVQMVGDRAHRRIWNTPIADKHPHGRSTLAGC